MPAARLPFGVGIEADFQTLGVHIVIERLHAGGKALRSRLYEAEGVAHTVPTVVDVDVLVACLARAAGHHGIRDFANELLTHIVHWNLFQLFQPIGGFWRGP